MDTNSISEVSNCFRMHRNLKGQITENARNMDVPSSTDSHKGCEHAWLKCSRNLGQKLKLRLGHFCWLHFLHQTRNEEWAMILFLTLQNSVGRGLIQWEFSSKVYPYDFPLIVLHTMSNYLHACGVCSEVVLEFRQTALNLGPWVWPSMNWYRIFFVQTSTPLPSMHRNLTERVRCCMQRTNSQPKAICW